MIRNPKSIKKIKKPKINGEFSLAIINNLETQQDIDNYKKWLSQIQLQKIILIKKNLEFDKIYRPNRWKNVDLKIELMEAEIKSRM